MNTQQQIAIYKQGSEAWKSAFNNGDAAGCAAQYSENSVMEARPFGIFKGRAAIQEFWQGIIDQGFDNVEYQNTQWEESQEKGYVLSSNWTMNKAYGVVVKEQWVIEDDGKARLIYDEFEVQGEK